MSLLLVLVVEASIDLGGFASKLIAICRVEREYRHFIQFKEFRIVYTK